MSTDRRALLAGAALAAPALATGARPAAAQVAAAAPAQAPGFYRFKVGGFTVTMVHDGVSRRPVEGFVRGVPTAEVQALLAESFLPGDQLTIPFTVTFVETPHGLFVLDSGTGAQLAPTAGQMAANMRAAGLDAARVQGVLVSHFHADHITGLTTAQNERAFPNAEIVVPAAEWAWWTDDSNSARSPEFQRPTFANTARRLGPYQGRIRQVRDGEEVVPGIRAVAAHGHTPGHTLYLIADGADQLMFLADLTNRPEIGARRPDWPIVFDFDGDAAAATRRRIFERVAAERIRVSGYHYPFPANGHIAREGQGFRFVPADWSGQV